MSTPGTEPPSKPGKGAGRPSRSSATDDLSELDAWVRDTSTRSHNGRRRRRRPGRPPTLTQLVKPEPRDAGATAQFSSGEPRGSARRRAGRQRVRSLAIPQERPGARGRSTRTARARRSTAIDSYRRGSARDRLLSSLTPRRDSRGRASRGFPTARRRASTADDELGDDQAGFGPRRPTRVFTSASPPRAARGPDDASDDDGARPRRPPAEPAAAAPAKSCGARSWCPTSRRPATSDSMFSEQTRGRRLQRARAPGCSRRAQSQPTVPPARPTRDGLPRQSRSATTKAAHQGPRCRGSTRPAGRTAHVCCAGGEAHDPRRRSTAPIPALGHARDDQPRAESERGPPPSEDDLLLARRRGRGRRPTKTSDSVAAPTSRRRPSLRGEAQGGRSPRNRRRCAGRGPTASTTRRSRRPCPGDDVAAFRRFPNQFFDDDLAAVFAGSHRVRRAAPRRAQTSSTRPVP